MPKKRNFEVDIGIWKITFDKFLHTFQVLPMSFEGASQTYETPSFFIGIFLPCLIFGSLFSYNIKLWQVQKLLKLKKLSLPTVVREVFSSFKRDFDNFYLFYLHNLIFCCIFAFNNW